MKQNNQISERKWGLLGILLTVFFLASCGAYTPFERGKTIPTKQTETSKQPTSSSPSQDQGSQDQNQTTQDNNSQDNGEQQPPSEALTLDRAYFEQNVKSILSSTFCTTCHNNPKNKGPTFEIASQLVVFVKPEESLLYQQIALNQDHDGVRSEDDS